MPCYQEILCPHCQSNDVIKIGRSKRDIQRYRCKSDACSVTSFQLDYQYKAYYPNIQKQMIDMAINGSGIRDTARVLGINKNTVISTLKKRTEILTQVNPIIHTLQTTEDGITVELQGVCEAEVDEQWSYVGNKSEQRWLWYAIDHATKVILAYVFGRRTDNVFMKLKTLLEPFKIKQYYTDNWGAYARNLDESHHCIGKKDTQSIERKNLNLRTRIKRLARKTICFSKSDVMHDTIIGLYINKVEFGRDIYLKTSF